MSEDTVGLDIDNEKHQGGHQWLSGERAAVPVPQDTVWGNGKQANCHGAITLEQFASNMIAEMLNQIDYSASEKPLCRSRLIGLCGSRVKSQVETLRKYGPQSIEGIIFAETAMAEVHCAPTFWDWGSFDGVGKSTLLEIKLMLREPVGIDDTAKQCTPGQFSHFSIGSLVSLRETDPSEFSVPEKSVPAASASIPCSSMPKIEILK